MKRHWILLTLILLLPTLLGLTTLLGVNTGTANASQISAAIVNNDEIATLDDGTQVPGGRQIIAALTKDDVNGEQSLNWSVVTEETAASGLHDGTYDAVITIPKDFSQSLVDILVNNSGDVPQLNLEVADGSSDAFGTLSNALAHSAASEFGTTLTVKYLTQSLEATGTIAEKIGQAADGARQVADGQVSATNGARQLADGTSTLASGSGQLADGTRTLANGASTLSSGLTQLASGSSSLADGARTLDKGLSALNDGSTTLASGAASLTTGVDSLKSGSTSLSDGATSLAGAVAKYTDGVRQLYAGITQSLDGTSPSLQAGAQQVAAGLTQLDQQLGALDTAALSALPGQLTAASNGASTIKTNADALPALISACQEGSAVACTGATQYAQGISSGAEQLATQLNHGATVAQSSVDSTGTQLQALKAGVSQLSAGATKVSSGIDTAVANMGQLVGQNASDLNSGASQVAAGATKLDQGVSQLSAGTHQVASGSSTLSNSIAQAHSGSSALSSGASTLANGALQANSGASQLSSGASTLASKTGELVNGTQTLNSGANQLVDGLNQLTDGSTTLANGLQSATDQIPTHSKAEAVSSAKALATPIDVTSTSSKQDTMTSWAPTAAVLALWLATMVGALAFGALNSKRVDSAATPAALAFSALWPNLIVSGVSAVILGGALRIAGVVITRPIATFVILVVSALALAIVQQALIAVFGQRMGLAISVVLFAFQAVLLVGIFAGQPTSGFISGLRGAMILPAVEGTLRALVLGVGTTNLGHTVGLLIAWSLLAFIVSIGAVAKRRQTSVSELQARLA